MAVVKSSIARVIKLDMVCSVSFITPNLKEVHHPNTRAHLLVSSN